MLSAVGTVTVEPTARLVPLSVQLQAIVALLLASIVMLDTVTLRLLEAYGAITAADALSEWDTSDVLVLDTRDTRSATVRAVIVTLRSAAIPWESSTVPR